MGKESKKKEKKPSPSFYNSNSYQYHSIHKQIVRLNK